MGRVARLSGDGLRLDPESRLVKARDWRAVVDASEIVAAAERRAAEIVAAAEAVYEERRREGYEEGVREGQGRVAEQMMETVAGAVDYVAGVEQDMVEIVGTALRRILGELPEGDAVVRVVRHALAAVRNQRTVKLRVAPEEVEPVNARLGEILAAYPAIGFLDVVADPRLVRGGAILESDIGLVDAGIDTQIESFRRALARHLGRGKADG